MSDFFNTMAPVIEIYLSFMLLMGVLIGLGFFVEWNSQNPGGPPEGLRGKGVSSTGKQFWMNGLASLVLTAIFVGAVWWFELPLTYLVE